MLASSADVDHFVAELPEARREKISQIREWIREFADPKLEECIHYKMIGYVIPHRIFPDGYHCNPSDPLPFLNIGNMKGHIGLYHMGLYADPQLLEAFKRTYQELTGHKANMGKSCLRLPPTLEVPRELIRFWCQAMSADRWLELYNQTQAKG